MTQKELAAKMGVPFQAGSRLERSENVPNYSTIERLAEALDVSPMVLIDIHDGISNNQDTENDGRHDLIKAFNSLNAFGQNKAIEYASALADNPKYQAEPPEPAEE